MNTVPLLIEFVRGTHLYREPAIIPKLPIIHNGPPGTFVVFTDGARVSLPTDQILLAEDSSGGARVGFGGMSFGGMDDGRLIFHRVRDLQPEELLSPERGRKMTLAPHMVTSIYVNGTPGLAFWLLVALVGCHVLARDCLRGLYGHRSSFFPPGRTQAR